MSSVIALNLAKFDAIQLYQSAQPFVFSLASYKRLALNRHLLERFISLFELDPTTIKSHPNFAPTALFIPNSVRSIV